MVTLVLAYELVRFWIYFWSIQDSAFSAKKYFFLVKNEQNHFAQKKYFLAEKIIFAQKI